MSQTGGSGIDRIVARPETLIQKSGEITRAARRLRAEFGELARLTNATQRYWLGDAAQEHRATYKELEPGIEEMFRRLEEHASDLTQIGMVYTGAQASVTQVASSLPTDAIE